MALPKKVIQEDARLSKAVETATDELAARTQELASLRWHWTLNEENPDRVSYAEYGRENGRSLSIVRQMARGYAEWVERQELRGVDSTPLADIVALQLYGADRRSVVEAYSAKTGTPATTTRNAEHRSIVDTAHDIAQQRAIRRGTSIAEESEAAVDWAVNGRKSRQRRAENRKAQRTMEYLSASASLHKARVALVKALGHVKDVQFNKTETRLLIEDCQRLEDALRLARLELTGESGIDWDKELTKLSEGGAA